MAVAKKKKGQTSFLEGLLSADFYKRNQGRMTRQLSAIGAGLIVAFGIYTLLTGPLNFSAPTVKLGVGGAIAAVFGWIIFRAVNFPRFADFLISVEAEMDKVAWPSRQEVYRATIVTLVVMFFLGFLLAVYDWFWQWFFRLIGFIV